MKLKERGKTKRGTVNKLCHARERVKVLEIFHVSEAFRPFSLSCRARVASSLAKHRCETEGSWRISCLMVWLRKVYKYCQTSRVRHGQTVQDGRSSGLIKHEAVIWFRVRVTSPLSALFVLLTDQLIQSEWDYWSKQTRAPLSLFFLPPPPPPFPFLPGMNRLRQIRQFCFQRKHLKGYICIQVASSCLTNIFKGEEIVIRTQCSCSFPRLGPPKKRKIEDETKIKKEASLRRYLSASNHFQPSKDTANQFNNAKIKFGFPSEK